MWFMCRVKRIACLLLMASLLTGCGEQQNTSEVLLYRKETEEGTEAEYTTVTVKRGTYKETVSGTGELYYTTENTVSVDDQNAYLDKICVKNQEKVKKGDILAIYHIRTSKTALKKKKLLLDQAKTAYDAELKSKESEMTAKKKEVESLREGAEKKIARIEWKRLRSEYKALVRSGKDVRRQEKEYRTLLKKQKKALVKSSYTGTVVDVSTVAEWEDTPITGEKLMQIRDESNFLIQANTEKGGLRYNMSVDVALGANTKSIRHHLKGRVISTDNLNSEAESTDEDGNVTTLVKVSAKDRRKYDFSKYNIYVTGTTMKIKNVLLADAKAVYQEANQEKTRLFVWVLDGGKLHKRYIVSNYNHETCYLVDQGLEEGQELAVLKNQKGEVK